MSAEANQRLLAEDLSSRVVQACFDVYNELGPGFLESVYESALQLVLGTRGLRSLRQAQVEIVFRGSVVGRFRADLVIEEEIILELKAVEKLLPEHEAQLLNLLRATRYELGFLFNFGPRPQIRRMIWTNDRKPFRAFP